MTAALPSIDTILRDGRLFRGGRPLAGGGQGLPSGLAALDAALPWAGFPRRALTEILTPHDGLGELGLLAPALVRLDGRIALVAPPWLPYPPALAAAGLPLARLAWIAANPDEAPWAAEQCLRAGCLGAVLAWSEDGGDRVPRRLQIAAEAGDCHGFLFRPARHAANPSPAALRLVLGGARGATRLRVLKCRGAVTPAAPLLLPRPH